MRRLLLLGGLLGCVDFSIVGMEDDRIDLRSSQPIPIPQPRDDYFYARKSSVYTSEESQGSSPGQTPSTSSSSNSFRRIDALVSNQIRTKVSQKKLVEKLETISGKFDDDGKGDEREKRSYNGGKIVRRKSSSSLGSSPSSSPSFPIVRKRSSGKITLSASAKKRAIQCSSQPAIPELESNES